MEENTNNGNMSGDIKPFPDTYILAFNLVALALYTIVMKFAGDTGFILDAFIIVIHLLLCIIMALAKRNGMWLLSGLMVLIIGFSTCVYVKPF